MKKLLTLVVLLFSISINAQEPNDCVNAITVCGNGNFVSNASGIGTIQEVSGCGGMEHNSIWLKINIVQAGTLGFELIPSSADLAVDYDFWVYGPNKTCGSLGSPIRCSTTNPLAAGLTSNHTGMYGATTATQVGPGANGDGYVRWLTVTAGQSYYIAIDRPIGDGGFELQWTGSATLNGGAFPTPPQANGIGEIKTCSNTPNTGIFDLNTVRNLVNPDVLNNTITFHTTLANAIDNILPLPNIIANSVNPQQIFVRVTNNVSKCYSVNDFTIKVYPVPNATILASHTEICTGNPSSFTITGTPNATINYNINNGVTQSLILDATGIYVFPENLTATTTYTLIEAKIVGSDGSVLCSKALLGTATTTVNQISVPTFTQVAPICQGGTLAALPTISDNGISGTWSPAINNITTTTYVFTPDDVTCTSTASMEIVVNTIQLPTFTQIASICQGETLAALPITSNNGISGTWSPVLNNAATTIYTFTPNSGECANTASMEIVVNTIQLPTFTQIAPICQGETLANLPTLSNNGISGTWSPALNNTATTIYTFTPNSGECGSTTTMEIVINASQIPTFTQVAPICQGATLAALPTLSNNGISGIWAPALNNSVTTTYTFTPTTAQCATAITMEIIVNPSQIPTFTQIVSICQGETLSALPTLSNNGISGTWSPALNNTATTTYTFTPNNGQCTSTTTMVIVVNSIQIPTFTQVAAICQGVALPSLPTTSNNSISGIWSPALNNTATTIYTFTPNTGQCASSTTMQIVVNSSLTPTFTQVAPICQGENIVALPTTSNNGISGIWSPALNNAVTTTYTFTPNNGQCAILATMEIVVNPRQTPTFTQVAPICQGATLSVLPAISNNGFSGTWFPALNNTATTTYTFTPISGECATSTTLEIVVNTLPSIAQNSITNCHNGMPGFSNFNLIQSIPAILGNTQSSANFEVTFFEDSLAAIQINSNSYTNTTADLQTIYVRIENRITGCFSVFPLDLKVEATTLATQPNDLVKCDYDGIIDGVEIFNLSALTTDVLNGQNPATFTVTYHQSLQNAQNNTNSILNLASYQNTASPYTQTIYIRVENLATSTACSIAITSVNLIVHGLLKPTIYTDLGINTICVDFATGNVLSGLILKNNFQGNNYTYKWYLNGTEIPGAVQSTYNIQTASPGLYTLLVNEISSVTDCNLQLSESFEVIQSGPPTIVEVIKSNAFAENQTISVIVQGYGIYWFQLDGGAILDNGGVFTNVAPGLHDVRVYDRKTENPSCGSDEILNIRLIDYPKYFTPNQDGYHDTWNIAGLRDQPNSLIYIFDRYGKVLASIKPSSNIGWDGIYNGNQLPSTDYWFKVIYEESGASKEFRAHFSMKR